MNKINEQYSIWHHRRAVLRDVLLEDSISSKKEFNELADEYLRCASIADLYEKLAEETKNGHY